MSGDLIEEAFNGVTPSASATIMQKKKFKSSIVWPKGLSDEDQILLGIGHLVASLSSCEYFFYVVLRCLAGQEGKRHHEVLWLSQISTRARIQLVLRVAKINRLSPKAFAEVEHCAKLMFGLSRLRNFYCHARYLNEEDGRARFEGYELSYDYADESMDLVRVKRRAVNGRSAVELIAAINRAERMYYKMLEVAHLVQQETGAFYADLPPLPE
ncbi:hypothetical protein TM233_58800 [Bradyrhizobium sp. TM233]|nr:hypothetical protein TM233_58800 [Bradyrhizobium sp. TM233]